jgi:HK97 family phage portal protein
MMLDWLRSMALRMLGLKQLRSTHPRDPALAEWWWGGSNTATGARITPEIAMECPAVQACVGLLANTIATLPLDLFERVDDAARERATDNPLWTLVHDAPNGYQTSAEFRSMMHTDLCQWNNAYARVVMSGGGPSALEPIRPGAIFPYRYGPNDRIAYRWTPEDGSSPRTLDPSEVLHLKRAPWKANRLEGRSLLDQHRETVATAMATIEYLARFFGNNATPNTILEVPAILSDTSAEALRQSWEKRHRGLVNAHRLAITDGGMKLHSIGMTNEQAEITDLYRACVADIARIYGVPLHLIGETEKATSWGTGIEQMSLGFLIYSLGTSAQPHPAVRRKPQDLLFRIQCRWLAARRF